MKQFPPVPPGFGGRPDVPPDFIWPVTSDGPCWFVAQVNLSECAKFDVGFKLPAGILSFFYHDAGGGEREGLESKVFLFDSDRLSRIDIVPDTRYGGTEFHEKHFFSRRLTLDQGYCIPVDLKVEDDSCEDVQGVLEVFNDMFANNSHQIFGLPPYLGTGYDEANDKWLEGFELLATFGEVHDRYYYMVPAADLTDLRLSSLAVLYGST
jgi:hypothetical protein